MNTQTEIFGHRGARGHFPENTLAGFMGTLSMGVRNLEFDVVISKDRKVVVSHEPWMSQVFCSGPDGSPVSGGRSFNLFLMDYEEIRKFDCGKRTNKKFPTQKPIPSYKPLLSEVIDELEVFAAKNGLPPVQYCIEVKSLKILEGKYQPPAAEFAQLVYDIIAGKGIWDRVIIISFDRNVLRHFHQFNKKIRTGFIFFNLYSVAANVRKLGFTPYSYHPYHALVTRKMIGNAHEMGMKVIVWTVNREKRMKRLMENGADGIMSDYPDVALRTCNRNVAV